jgi:pimeloyl-ACP methyl ester carboxylesterase
MTTPGRVVGIDGAEGSTPTLEVTSRDGTPIAVWASGEGPPLLLVHGTSGDHSRFRPLLPYLEPHATVYAMDRRGRGGSGDGPVYDPMREYEDVAAVVDAIADATGSPVDVYGHSQGAFCAWGAATLTTNIRRLVLFEGVPLLHPEAWQLPEGIAARMDRLIADGEPERALLLFWQEVVGLSDAEIESVRAQPSWAGRVAAAHTIAREVVAYLDTSFDPVHAARITVPVLLVAGSESADPSAAEVESVATALPDARIVVLRGQHHVADTLAPEVFAEPVLAFLREGR